MKPLFRLLAAAAFGLCACQQAAEPPVRPKGDEVLPGHTQVAGLLWCDAARIELVAIVLGGPPKPLALEDVHDAAATGCTWAASGGAARVRLNVYDAPMIAAARTGTPAGEFNARATAHAQAFGQGAEAPDLGIRAARFGFATPRSAGALIVETPTRVLEFESSEIPAPKLIVFARGVIQNIETEGAEAAP